MQPPAESRLLQDIFSYYTFKSRLPEYSYRQDWLDTLPMPCYIASSFLVRLTIPLCGWCIQLSKYLHEGCIPLHLPEGKHNLVAGPFKWYCGSHKNDTDSPVQYREPRLCPLDGEPGSSHFTRAER